VIETLASLGIEHLQVSQADLDELAAAKAALMKK
jgi:hypothetical protein